MRMNLWKKVAIGLSVPLFIAAVIAAYALLNINKLSNRITHIKAADDINMALLDLRRYEKNILLFHDEEQNIQKLRETLESIDKKIRGIEDEMLREINLRNYQLLNDAISEYRRYSEQLIETVRTEDKLIHEIRPIGRMIENNSLLKEAVIELRSHEKNFLIYHEKPPIDKLKNSASKLVSFEPSLSKTVRDYIHVFEALISNDARKQDAVSKLRHFGREIVKIAKEFSEKERMDINAAIAFAKKLLIISFIFLLLSIAIVIYHFSSNVVNALKAVENSMITRVKLGDFSHGISIQKDAAPEEILSFIETYNNTVRRLGESKEELEKTLEQLKFANRELIEKQEEIIENRKLSALRLLSAEIAHEVNNPLSSLITILHIFLEEIPEDDQRRETLELAMKDAKRSHAIVSKLADFARREPLKFQEINPADLINEAIQTVSTQKSKNIDNIHIVFAPDGLPAKFNADPVLLLQAFVNIIGNACDFSPPKGKVYITGSVNDNKVVIEVSDEGYGISEENMKQIFEPFFTSRKTSGGSGLGLAIARKIVEKHNGFIRVESLIGKGTIFKILLPIDNKHDDKDTGNR